MCASGLAKVQRHLSSGSDGGEDGRVVPGARMAVRYNHSLFFPPAGLLAEPSQVGALMALKSG